MKKLLFLMLQAHFCLGMFAPMEHAKTQSVQPQFTIAYLSLKSSHLTVQENAFKHAQEISLHSCTRGMHYFEVHMRKLCVNGSAYLRTIRDAIQSTIDKLGLRNTQRSVMDKHKEIIEMVLSEPDMQRIDAYLEVQALVQHGKASEAFERVSAYQALYGECDSAQELRQLVGGRSYASTVVSTVRYLVGADKDVKIGEPELSSSAQVQGYGGIYHDGRGTSSTGRPDHHAILDRARQTVRDIRSRTPVQPKKTLVPKQEPTVPSQSAEHEKKQQELQRQQALRVKQEAERKQQLIKELEVNTPSKIAHVLQSSENKQALVHNLHSTKDSVYANAEKYGYIIHPELDAHIKSSIDSLLLCTNPHEFIFHVATTNHLLTDIQIHTAQEAGIAPSLLQKAPELFGHGIEKYCEYLIAPTENEVTLLVSLAQYISDTTAGTHYLTPEMREARIAQFWDGLSNLCDTTPAKLVDNCMYAAARVTWAVGIIKAAQVIEGAALAVGQYAHQFIQNFDQVISNNPVMVTVEGAIVVAAQQELGWGQSIGRAIWGPPKNEINSVDGLMNFLESEKNPANSNSLLKNKKTVQDLIKESKPGTKTQGPTTQYERFGDLKKTIEDFESLRPKDVKDIPNIKGFGRRGTLDDGSTVIVREFSRGGPDYNGGATLEIQCGKTYIKFRYL